MITGAIWEKDVFGQYLFAKPFFWEDMVSMLVLALHTLYLVMLLGQIGGVFSQLTIALAAYATYVINAVQFVWKLRQARLELARIELANVDVPHPDNLQNRDPNRDQPIPSIANDLARQGVHG